MLPYTHTHTHTNIYLPSQGSVFSSLLTSEILEKVKHGTDPPFRPAVEVSAKMADMKELMVKCWHENPKDRPSAHVVKGAIKRIAV